MTFDLEGIRKDQVGKTTGDNKKSWGRDVEGDEDREAAGC